MGGNACVVRGRVSRQRQVRGDHVSAIRPGDPERDRHLQPPTQTQTQTCHTGDGQPN